MARNDGGVSQINQLRGAIYQATQQRQTTAQTWATIRSHLGLPDEGPTGIRRGLVNAIWHEAVSVRNAGEAFARAADRAETIGRETAITSNMVAVPTWARPQAERNTAPMFQINFQMEMEDEEGNPDTGWFTVIKRGALPASTQALQDMIDFDAEQMAGRYGNTFVSASSITILAI